MVWTQAPEATTTVDVDPVDLLVPPPRTFRRSLVLTGVAVLVVVAVVFTSTSGLLRPRLGLALTGSFTEAGPTSVPSVTFNVRNNGHLSLSIVGVDARAPGIGPARVTVAPLSPDGEVETTHRFPLTVRGGRAARVTMTFAAWNCKKIELHHGNTVPIHVASPLGLEATVSLVPGFHFDPPGAGVLIGSPDQNEIGWAAGITWTSWHPGSATPNADIPSP